MALRGPGCLRRVSRSFDWRCVITIDSRFWNKVLKTDSCWVWNAAKSKGYGLFYSNGKMVRSHRYLFEIINGPIPTGMQLDHKCHCRSCVNPLHLRIVSNTQNQYNATRRADNSSGLKGVSLDKQSGKWKAAIRINGKRTCLGRFLTKEDAHSAYCAAAIRLFGEYANDGSARHPLLSSRE